MRVVETARILFMISALSAAAARASDTAPAPITEYPVNTTGGQMNGVALGPDGNVWFVDYSGNIDRITPAGVISVFPTLPPQFSLSGPNQIVAGPDGAMWFTETECCFSGLSIGRMTTSGAVTHMRYTSNSLQPIAIAKGPDGNLWILETNKSRVAKMTTSGAVTEYLVPTDGLEMGDKIVAGADGNLWFTESYGTGKIGRITPAGVFTEFTTGITGSPRGITAGSDGNIWFTEYLGNKIGRITPAGVVTEFPVPAGNSAPGDITSGPDGSLWFTDYGAKVSRITTSGLITQFLTPGTSLSRPEGIVAGADGNIWFAETTAVKMGRLVPPASSLTVGAVFSSAQPSSQSFLRFYNSGSKAGTVTVKLQDYVSGQTLGTWTSPSIAAGAALQYQIGSIESSVTPAFTVPNYYTIAVQTGINGAFQHVLWRSSDGTLTNLTTCSSGVTASQSELNNVHSSILAAGYPSSVVVNNTGTTSAKVSLDIYDARDGTFLGTYATSTISAGGDAVIAVSAMEDATRITPTAGMYHYVIKAEAPFTGFLQHLVNNVQDGVVTDMTTSCMLYGTPSTAGASPLQVGAVFSTAQPSSQSFLRFYNTGTTAGTVTITLSDYASGQRIGTWTSPSIPAGSEQQFGIGTIESGIGGSFSKPSYYTVSATVQITGYFQHVLWRSADGTLTNLSTCPAGVTADAGSLSGVHTSLLANGYPSTLVVNNTGSAAQSVTLGIYDAATGAKLGTYATASIPAGGDVVLAVTTIEASAGIHPTSSQYHYVVKAESAFTGFMQNLVNNTQAGVITDMTTACALAMAGS